MIYMGMSGEPYDSPKHKPLVLLLAGEGTLQETPLNMIQPLYNSGRVDQGRRLSRLTSVAVIYPWHGSTA